MPYMIRHLDETIKLSDAVALEALDSAIPQALIDQVIVETGATQPRRRELPADVTLLLVIAMNLWTDEALRGVLRHVLQGVRFVGPDPEAVPATKSAISQARYRLGARAVVALFRRVCQPLATTQTPDAFRFGLRLMAVDGTTEVVPDTPANAGYFGRPTNQHGGCALPQVAGVYLLECGSHAVVDAGFWPYGTNERLGALRVLRSVPPDTLLMWDRGLHSYAMAVATRRREAHFLGRVASHLVLTPMRVLADGTYLAQLWPAERAHRATATPLTVRVIEYSLDDPTRVGQGEVHRLMTSLLDPVQASALDLVCTYHDRWEAELVIDELDTHLRLLPRPIRSLKPVGVLQELYGALLAHYAVRKLMLAAAQTANLSPRRLSFVHAVRLIKLAIPEFQMLAACEHPRLYRRLLHDLLQEVLPERANRVNPRVVRRKVSKFRVKRPEHYHLPQPTRPFRDTVVLLI